MKQGSAGGFAKQEAHHKIYFYISDACQAWGHRRRFHAADI